MNYLADTTVIIEHLRCGGKATDFLEKFSPSISTVTIAELIQGCSDRRQQRQVRSTVKGLPEVFIDKKICEKAIESIEKFYLSHSLEFLDALIAATALTHNMILVTDNKKHFKSIPGLKILSHTEAFDN